MINITQTADIPMGKVGVVTRLFGARGEVESAPLAEGQAPSRLVVGEQQRGILPDVLQPGIYYLNPRLYKVSIMPIGYDAITLEHPKNQIRFYSFDGYLVEAFGAPQSYNLYTFAKHLQPSDLRLIFARAGNVLDRPEELRAGRGQYGDRADTGQKALNGMPVKFLPCVLMNKSLTETL